MKKRIWILSLISCLCLILQAQEDPILFTVADVQVPVSEFRYIYTKNNRDNADYTRATVNEYLDLYTRFKLKVKRAKDLQLDTIDALQTELAGYRAQLAKSYLNDKEVIDKLTREAYVRMQSDIHVAHILFRVELSAPAEDVARAYENARQVAARAQAGNDFAALAKAHSEDKNTADRGGDLGYLTSMLPTGFYAVENAIYGLETGQISEPVRSSLGYHVFKVLGRRPARGEIEASHIFVRVKEDSSNAAAARQKIFALYENLRNGANFEELARTVSDDQQTARRGGFIGRFGINSYDPVFEDAAFALENEGSFTEPVRTRVGWHIIRLVKKHELGSYEDEKTRLEARITRDERVNVAKQAMIETIKVESGLTEMAAARDTFINTLREDFLTFQWAPEIRPTTLVKFADGTEKTTADFVEFLRTKTRERMRAAKTASPQAVAMTLYNEWLDELCLSYEEKRLEEKYPDFKALMREYEEGILLFEVTKMMVWDKASQDTAGLRAFFSAHREDYMWPERAEVVQITIEGENAAKTEAKARKMLATKSVEEVAAKLNKKSQQVAFQRKKYFREELMEKGMEWQAGFTTETVENAESGTRVFSYVSLILPPQPKALDEARGYVIADYQDHLEQEWVKSLRADYPVQVNEQVLNSLIKS